MASELQGFKTSVAKVGTLQEQIFQNYGCWYPHNARCQAISGENSIDLVLQQHGSLITGRSLNTLRPRQDGRYFADDVLKCIFFNENVWISLKIPLKFVPKGPVNNIPALVQIMAWCRPGDKPLSEPMLVFVPTHIWVTGPQWVKIKYWKMLYQF